MELRPERGHLGGSALVGPPILQTEGHVFRQLVHGLFLDGRHVEKNTIAILGPVLSVSLQNPKDLFVFGLD